MSSMALFTIALIILLIVLLMLFYRFGTVRGIDKTRSGVLATAGQRSGEVTRMAVHLSDTAAIIERRAGSDRRLLLLVRGQLGGYRDRRHHSGRRREDRLWIH